MLCRQVIRRFPASPATWAKQSHRVVFALKRDMATPAKPPSPNDPFANGTNAYYAEEMYRIWRQDPKAVHASWDVYFRGMDKGLSSPQAFQPPPTTTQHLPPPADGAPALYSTSGELDDHLKVSDMTQHVYHKIFIPVFSRSNCLCEHIKFGVTMSRTWIL